MLEISLLWWQFFLFIARCYCVCKYIKKSYSSVKCYKQKHVLITGCDSGFGLATALKLSASNCIVYAGCLTQNGVKRLQNKTTFKGIAFIMDVTKDDDVEEARKMIEKETEGKGLDGVVNNAGIVTFGLIEWQSMKELQRGMDVNFWGTVRTIKTMIPLLKIAKGRVVNFSSTAGFIALPWSGVYPASKFAIEAFSDSLRNEIKPWGVTVHIIQPGGHKTEIIQKSRVQKQWKDIWMRQNEETKQEIGNNFQIFLDNFLDKLDKTASSNLDGVTEAVHHALLSDCPKSRYMVARFRLLINILRYLPESWFDYFLSFAPQLEPIHVNGTKKD